MNKIGLVVEGGGMKCAYSAGVLDAFLDEHISFDYCIGVSAGSGNIASFLAGQRDRNRRFFTDHMGEADYFGLRSLIRSGNIFGLQYIYGTLTNSNGTDPLDFPALVNNPSEYKLVATNAKTGKPAYFDKNDLKQDDYRPIMASCAIPMVCRPVEINGEYYYDGGVSDAIPAQKALDDGCDRIVAILSKPRDYLKPPQKYRMIYSRACHKYPKTVEALDNRHIMYRACQEKIFELEKEGKAFLFIPSSPPQMGTYTMKKEIEQQLYDLGIRDFKKMYYDFMKFMGRKHTENERMI